MAKVNFSKVEDAFDDALKKLVIDHLSELASIANVLQDPNTLVSNKNIEEIIHRFQKELKKLKKQDAKLYERLNLSVEDEENFAKSPQNFLQSDWLRIRDLKVKIDELKHELYGQEVLDSAHENQVAKERKRHVNKRFNIRDGWLPLQ